MLCVLSVHLSEGKGHTFSQCLRKFVVLLHVPLSATGQAALVGLDYYCVG